MLISVLLTACKSKEIKNGESNIETTSYADSSQSSQSAVQASTNESSKSSNTDANNQHSNPQSSSQPIINDNTNKLYVSEYGAKGDGKNDDTLAINQAIAAASVVGKQVSIEFDKGKIYYIGGNGSLAGQNVFKGALIIERAKNITVNGNGSTLLLKPGQVAGCIAGTENVAINGFNIDYSIPTYAIGTVIARGDSYVDFKTDINLNFESANTYNAPADDYFAIPVGKNSYGTQTRSHNWIKKIDKISNNSCRVYFRKSPGSSTGVGTINNVGEYANGAKWYLPNPGVGQAFGELFFVGFNKNTYFSNIKINAASSFVFAIKGNDGEIKFDNVDILPKAEHDPVMVSWRDGFHCKDNLKPLIFNNCEIDGLFDDAFNISATMHYITNIISSTNVEIKCFELGGTYYGIKPGDEITVIDATGSGAVKGTAFVKKAISNGNGFRIELDKPIENMKTNNRLTINNRAAPGSKINNCKFTGTFRFRGKIDINNTVFNPLAIWVMYEGHAEGPIPKDVMFNNCTFNGGNVEVGCYSREFGRGLYNISTKNIVFKNCTFNGTSKKLHIGSDVVW